MFWDDASVAGFARRTGWQGGDLTTAVAIALATSHGDDAYEYVPPFGLPGHEVGLWGIPVDIFRNLDVSLMRNPVANAQAAHDLWLFFGRAWGIFSAYDSGAYRTRAFEAAVATTQPSAVQFGFGVAGTDVDPSDLLSVASGGVRSVGNLETVVRGL